MKRPLAVMGFSYLVAAFLACTFPPRVCVAVGAVLLVCGALAVASRHRMRGYVICILGTCAVAFFMAYLAYGLRLEPARAKAGQTVQLSGRVTTVLGERSVEVRDENGIGIALYSGELLDARVGQAVFATVRLSLYEDGSMSPTAALRAKQTPLRGFALGGVRLQNPPLRTWARFLLDTRERLSAALRWRVPGEDGALLCGMLLGERQRISPQRAGAFQDAGISHLLAISGYHVALISSLILGILRVLRCPRRLASLLTALAVILYMALVGFSATVVRAGLMTLFYLVATTLRRQADSLTSLAAAALAICFVDPFAAAQTSFLLSFLATLGIVLFAAPMQTTLEKRCRRLPLPRIRGLVGSALCVSLCATLATLPVVLLRFDAFPLYALLANVLSAPLVPVAMTCGLAVAVLGIFSGGHILTVPFAWAARGATALLGLLANMVASFPMARLPADVGFVPLWLAGAACMVAVALVQPSSRKTRACTALAVASLAVGMLSYQLFTRGTVRLTVVTTGHSAVFVAVKDRHAALLGDICTEAEALAVRRALRRFPVTAIELVALIPAEQERTGAVAALLAEYPVRMAVLDTADLEDRRMTQALLGAVLCEWNSGDAVTFFGQDRVSLHPNGIFAQFTGAKAFIPGKECDILNCIAQEGRPLIAAMGDNLPAHANELRCAWLVMRGGAWQDVALQEALRSTRAGDAAMFLLRGGHARLLERPYGMVETK